MNDFSKEELGIIYCNLCANPKTKDILSKLQDMIDNYCEHPICYIDYDYQTTRCKKCLEVVE
jgi:hypothetical protein